MCSMKSFNFGLKKSPHAKFSLNPVQINKFGSATLVVAIVILLYDGLYRELYFMTGQL